MSVVLCGEVLLLLASSWCIVSGTHDRICSPGDIRLVDNKTSPLIGKVEVCIGGMWGRVCNSIFDRNEMKVACRQLGFLPNGTHASTGDLLSTRNLVLMKITGGCHGDEEKLTDCRHDEHNFSCMNNNTAAVQCFDASPLGNVKAVNEHNSSLVILWTRPGTNQQVNEPITSYTIECSANVLDFHHVVSVSVNSSTMTTSLQGLQQPDHNTTYTCCVTAVYETYNTKDCTQTNTSALAIPPSSSTTSLPITHISTSDSCNSGSVGGALGAIIVVLCMISVLLISVLVYVLCIRQQVITEKYPTKHTDNTMDNPTYNGRSNTHQKQPGTAGTLSQTNITPTTQQYERIDPAYETLEGPHSPAHTQREAANKRRALAARYEFAELPSNNGGHVYEKPEPVTTDKTTNQHRHSSKPVVGRTETDPAGESGVYNNRDVTAALSQAETGYSHLYY